MNTIEKRSAYVAERLIRELRVVADESRGDGWDGRELLLGLGAAFKQACIELDIQPAQAVALLANLEVREVPNIVQLVKPNGRPLGAV